VAASTTGPNEIWLNGNKYPLARDTSVRSFLSSQYPPKRVEGDFKGDSDPRRSVVHWNDFSGGMGIDRITKPEHMNRTWLFSGVDLRYPGFVTNLPLLSGTADVSGHADSVTAINELNLSGTRTIFAAWKNGLDIRKYDNSSSWGTSLHTLDDQATDSINVRMNGTEYLIFAHYDTSGSGWTFTSIGGATSDFSTNDKDTKFLTFWDDRLWGINHNGLLWQFPPNATPTTAAGDCVDDAQLPLPNGYVAKLFTGPDATGEEIIYASTKVGLYAHDVENQRFIKTGLSYPEQTNSGKGATTWRGQIYVSSGASVYQYTPGTTAVIIDIGADIAQYVPLTTTTTTPIRSDIVQLVGTHLDLLAGQDSGVRDADVGQVMAWTGKGWSMLANNVRNCSVLYPSNAYGSYRLWYGSHKGGNSKEGGVEHLPLEQDLAHPDQSITRTFVVHADDLYTPWFDAGQINIDKLALKLDIHVTDATSTEKVVVKYFLDYALLGSISNAITPTSLGEITSSGVTSYTFGSTGVPFKSIMFRLAPHRGSTTTKTPKIRSISFEYRKKLTAKWGANFKLNLSENYNNNTPKAMISNLVTAAESNTLVEFTYRDPNADSEATYQVDIANLGGVHRTGREYVGDEVEVTVVEP
jgi:hypothetical protein